MKDESAKGEQGLKKALKSDPYAGMKVSLAKTVLAGRKPTLAKLEKAFMEEFGAPPPPKLVQAFIKKLPQDQRPLPPLKPIHVTVNLIHERSMRDIQDQMRKTLEVRGGGVVTLALEKDALDLFAPLKAVYGLESNEDLVTMALKILEQQARGIAPELFEPLQKT